MNFVPGNLGTASTLERTDGEDTVSIDTDTIRFNDFMSEYNLSSIDFMKIDAQGAEYRLIQDIELNHVNKLVLEIHGSAFLSVTEATQILDRLTEYGRVELLNGGRDIQSIDDIDINNNPMVLWVKD